MTSSLFFLALSFDSINDILDDNLAHLHERLHRARTLVRLRLGHDLRDVLGHNLPGHSVFVFQPSAHLLRLVTTLTQLVPVMVDFVLIVAHDLKTNGFGKRDFSGFGVQRGELVAVELEDDTHGRVGWLFENLFASTGKASNVSDGRVGEDGSIEVGSIFSLGFEKEAIDNLA